MMCDSTTISTRDVDLESYRPLLFDGYSPAMRIFDNKYTPVNGHSECKLFLGCEHRWHKL